MLYVFVRPVDKYQTLGHIEHYFVTVEQKKVSEVHCVRKKVLSLHGLHSLHRGSRSFLYEPYASNYEGLYRIFYKISMEVLK